MKITIVGDWTYQNFRGLTNDVKGFIESNDYLLYNFETAIDFGGFKKKKAHNFSINDKSRLFLSNKTICHLANNHVNDLGEENGLNTIKYVLERSCGIGIVSEMYRIKPYVIKGAGSENVAVIGCSQMKYEGKTFSFLHYKSEKLFKLISILKKSVNKILLSIHWGCEQNYIPSPWQRKYARRCIEAGVDLLVGHHSHIFQPFEDYMGKRIYYSIGNFQIPTTSNTNVIAQKYSNIIVYDTQQNDIIIQPILIINSNPLILRNIKIIKFYMNFDNRYLTAKNFFIYSLSDHYSQNWEAWKLRFKKYGIIEYLKFIMFLFFITNFVGMINYTLFRKILRKEFNPAQYFNENEAPSHKN